MNLRKMAGLLAVVGLLTGLVGSGVAASFADQVFGQENIAVGTFACIIVNPSNGTIAGDSKSVTYNAPPITSSAAGNAPFQFSVKNTGSIAQVLTVAKTGQTGNLSGKFSDTPATVSPAALAPGATALVSTGIQWTTLDNGDLGRSGSMTWTVDCNEGAGADVIFDNSAAVLAPNYASYGPEAYSYNEWGGAVTFAGTSRKLSTATVTLSSWACETGGGDTCVTTPGATFPVAITFNVYDTSLALIATKTDTFNVPYRPSADTVNCTSDYATPWFDGSNCYHGLANNITFTFAGETVPNNAVFGIMFNTDNHGYTPINGSGSPTDSLNIATYPGNGSSTPASVGAWAPDDVSAYLANDITATPFGGPVTNMPTGPGDDFVGYMPAVQISATP